MTTLELSPLQVETLVALLGDAVQEMRVNLAGDDIAKSQCLAIGCTLRDAENILEKLGYAVRDGRLVELIDGA